MRLLKIICYLAKIQIPACMPRIQSYEAFFHHSTFRLPLDCRTFDSLCPLCCSLCSFVRESSKFFATVALYSDCRRQFSQYFHATIRTLEKLGQKKKQREALNMIKYPVAIWTIPFKHLTRMDMTRQAPPHYGFKRLKPAQNKFR